MEQMIFGGRYKVHAKLGEGGMAFVYLALDTKLDRQVAIKVLHKHMLKNQDVRERFETEARAVSQLEHPNVIKIYDYSGQDSEDLWIVMELIDGWNLAQYVEQFPGRYLHPIISTCIIREICKALAKAHLTGLVHRDIKPENIMIMRDGHVKLMDFGIVKDLSKSNLTQVGTFMGSPSYMSPEQIRGRNVDLRSDLYSLSIMYYEIVTGHLPFTGSSTQDVVLKIIDGNYVAPRLLMPSLPATIDAIIVGGIQKSPGNRYQNAAEISSRIDQYLEAHGFVESHVELERFFLDRNGYLQRLANSDYGRSTATLTRTHSINASESVSGQVASTIFTESIDRESRISKGSRASGDVSTLLNDTVKLSHASEVLKNVPREIRSKNWTNNAQLAEGPTVKISQNRPLHFQDPDVQQTPVGKSGPRMSYNRLMDRSQNKVQILADADHVRKPQRIDVFTSNWFSQLLGIVLIGGVVIISLFGFWQLRQKIETNTKTSGTHEYLNTPSSRGKLADRNGQKRIPSQAPASLTLQTKPKGVSSDVDGSARDHSTSGQNKAVPPVDNAQVAAKSSKIIGPRMAPFPVTNNPETETPNIRTATESKIAVVGPSKVQPPGKIKSNLPPVFKVASRPASLIFIDGKKVGTTNDATTNSGWLALSSGKRSLELKRDGFITHHQIIEANLGDRIELPTINLRESDLVTLILKTRHGGCRVEITDLATKIALPPFTINTGSRSLPLRPGTYHLKIQFASYIKERIIKITSSEGPIVFDVGEIM
jgi:serine/threonine protein kinase